MRSVLWLKCGVPIAPKVYSGHALHLLVLSDDAYHLVVQARELQKHQYQRSKASDYRGHSGHDPLAMMALGLSVASL
jgi:hypothetical protein